MTARATVLRWCVAALLGCATWGALAQGIAQKAKEEGCSDKPVRLPGSEMYKCTSKSGNAAYFNVPDATPDSAGSTKAAASAATRSASVPTPSSFPKVDAGTQKSRDDLRRRVLQDELASEEKLLVEARGAWAEGSPPPLPEERTSAQKYADRLARLRQTVQLHERNVEALKRELAAR
ncbi:MAG: DUF4124 domain-containing protein [Betaproteobacteria bacterium]